MEFLEAATNTTSASLCLAVPSFFSGNIFYCYLGLAPRRRRRRCNAFPPSSPAPASLPPSLPATLPPLAAHSFFLPHPLIHPAAHRAYEHLARNSPLHNATQFRSPHPPGDFIIRFCLRLVLAPSLSQSSCSSCRSVFSFARVALYRRYFDDDAECEKER